MALELLAAPKCDEPIGELDGLPGVRQERPLRAVRAVGHARRPAARARQAEDGEPVQDDDARADHDGRGRGAAAAAARRSARTRPTASRSSPTTVATGRTCRRARTTATSTTRSGCSRSRSTRRWRSSPSRRCTGAAGANMAAKGPLREFGNDPVSGRPVVAKDGRFGVYVTDGETNASLGKGDRLEEMTPERAYELLAVRRERSRPRAARPAKRPPQAAPRSAGAKKQPTARKKRRPAWPDAAGRRTSPSRGPKGAARARRQRCSPTRSAPCSPGRPAGPIGGGCGRSSTTSTSSTSTTAPRR